jgi:pimeloyl-ACP methyl ester carboxylesterase
MDLYRPSGKRRSLAAIATVVALCTGTQTAGAQVPELSSTPPGRLVDLGGYRLHLHCSGTRAPGAPTIVLSIGAGGFADDWSRVQKPLSDSVRVCSYDRPGYGWSDAGPTPRTIAQEAHEVRTALDSAGERPPFILVGQSMGGMVVRRVATTHRADVAGIILVEPANENGYLGYSGRWVIPRTLASGRSVPSVRSFAESPPTPKPDVDGSTCRTGGPRIVRLFRCFAPQDDFFAEEMSAFYDAWKVTPHPLGNVPLVEIRGTRPRTPPPGLSAAQLRADSSRLDLSKLSTRSRVVSDPLSGHHVQRDNPELIVAEVLEMVRKRPQ